MTRFFYLFSGILTGAMLPPAPGENIIAMLMGVGITIYAAMVIAGWIYFSDKDIYEIEDVD